MTAKFKENVPSTIVVEKAIPNNAIVLYITLDPRSHDEAEEEVRHRLRMMEIQDTRAALKERTASASVSASVSASASSTTLPMLEKSSKLEDEKNRRARDPIHAYKTHLHKHAAESLYLDADVDLEPDDLVSRKKLVEFFDSHGLWKFVAVTLKTRGGYHIVISTKGMLDPLRKALHSWPAEHGFIIRNSATLPQKISWISIHKCSQVPLAGTLQGGYPVTMIDLRAEVVSMLRGSTTTSALPILTAPTLPLPLPVLPLSRKELRRQKAKLLEKERKITVDKT